MLQKSGKAAIYLVVLAAIGLIYTCENFRSVKQQDKASRLLHLKDQFKYRDLKVFETDTFNFDNRPGHYNEVDSNTFKLIFQQEDRNFIGQGYDRDYFYSWQDRDAKFIELVMLTQEESGYCDMLRYYIFDKHGNFLSSFDIAASCGDAEWTFTGSGKQLSHHEFFYQTVESDQKRGYASNSELLEGDSIEYLIRIDSAGQVNKHEMARKHFVISN
jgi:hypothetical protein